MSIRSIFAACTLILAPAAAFADPTGSFDVVGTNPSGAQYTGTVDVVRKGETYQVYWNIAGKEFIGTGIGAKFVGDRFEMGPASEDDTAISVGYVAEDSFGIAMFFEQPDGEWQGVWTYGGSETVIGENWTRK